MKLNNGSIVVQNRRFIKVNKNTENTTANEQSKKDSKAKGVSEKRVSFRPLSFQCYNNTNFNVMPLKPPVKTVVNREQKEQLSSALRVHDNDDSVKNVGKVPN